MQPFVKLLALKPLVTATVGAVALATAGAVLVMSSPLGAKPTPPPTVAPTITSGPTGAVASSSASFTVTIPSGATGLVCGLDGANLKPCVSPVEYSGLADGAHTFAVAGVNGGSKPGPTASRTWTVDRLTPPATAVASPRLGSNVSSEAWVNGCASGAGICGTATDAIGVATVEVAVRQDDTGRFWDGAAFASTSLTFHIAFQGAATSTTWHLPVAEPANSGYSLLVRATDVNGNRTPEGAWAVGSFIYDSTVPVLQITAGPDDPTFSNNAELRYTVSEPATVECSLDGAPFATCDGRRMRYSDLAPARHCFEARPIDEAGNVGATEQRCWTVVLQKSIGISGSVRDPLFPGRRSPIDVTFANPYNFDVEIVSLTIAAAAGSSNTGCSGADHLDVAREMATAPARIIVPAGSTRSLSQLGIGEAQWPEVEMINLPVNQDACKGATFQLDYSAAVTKP